jgi:hypothetical protein
VSWIETTRTERIEVNLRAAVMSLEMIRPKGNSVTAVPHIYEELFDAFRFSRMSKDGMRLVIQHHFGP